MNQPVYIPVRLVREIKDTFSNYAVGELGHVCKFPNGITSAGKWWFIPNGKLIEDGFEINQDDFHVIRSKNPKKPYLRLASVPYGIIYHACYLATDNDKTVIDEAADQAINLLVRYAEELEKRVKELEDARLSDEL